MWKLELREIVCPWYIAERRNSTPGQRCVRITSSASGIHLRRIETLAASSYARASTIYGALASGCDVDPVAEREDRVLLTTQMEQIE
jgi:hypothetical protein